MMHRFIRTSPKICVFLALLITLPHWLQAQSNRGTIVGTVVDSSGAVVPGANVTAVETNTNTTYHVVSTAGGGYTLPQVVLGIYKIDAQKDGFATQEKTGIQVFIGTTSTVNFQLAAGGGSQTVTVSDAAPSLETSTSEMGGVITSKQVLELPLSLGGVGAFRSPEAFAFLLPGVVGPGTASSSNGIYIQKTSGGENFGDDVLLDGTSAARPDNGSTFDETSPSVEALQEFKVLTATPPAQYDRTTGGVRSFTTRSGTNSFHGSAYDFLRNTVLDANTWFNDLQRATNAPAGSPGYATYATPSEQKNDYGVSLGGPVIIPHLYDGRNKTFFYFAWEQLTWPRSSTSTTTVPTTAMRNGDFSAIMTNNQIGTNPCTGAAVYAGQIFDPQSQPDANTLCRTTAFAGNQIPSARFDPVALKVLSYLPQPTNGGLVNNYSFRSSFPTNNTTYTIRIDQNISASDHLFASYNTRENSLLTGGTPILPNPIDPNTWNQDFITHYGRVGWDHVFTSNLTNHLNLGTNRTNSVNTSAAVGNTNWGSVLGLGNVSGRPFPRFNIGGYDSIGRNTGDDDIGNEADVFDTVTWIRGRHTLSMGGDYRWIQYNNIAFDNSSGIFDFDAGQTTAGNSGTINSQGGYAFASFLLGHPNDASLTVFPHYPRYTSSYFALFVQDDFKVNQKLTLNLGFRWSVDQPRKEAQNFTSNFDPNIQNPGAPGRLGALEFASDCGGCNPRWVDTYYKAVGPRIGFAFTPYASGTTVFRGGYGILYGPLYYADFANSMNAGYAATPNPTATDGFSSPFTLANGFPAYQTAPILDPSIRNGTSVDYIAPTFNRPPMIQNWTLQVQQQLAPDLILSIGYVGNKGQNLRSASGFGQYNNVRPGALALGQNVLNAQINSPEATAAGITSPYAGFNSTVGNSLRPYPQYTRFNTDCCLENDGMSNYNALEVMLQRNFRQGFNLQASYTWSKALNDADSLQPGSNAGGGLYQNPFDQHQEKALSSQDLTHMFVLSGLYDLPVGKGRHFLNKNPWVDAIVGGWRTGAILRYESGQPLPFYCATGVSGWDNCFRFNLAQGASVYNAARHQSGFNPLTTPYLNNAAFVDPNPDPNAPIKFGSLPRVTGFRMDPYYEEDLTLAKDFHIREVATFQLRADAFNAFNRHVFAEPYNLGPAPNAGANNTFGYVNSTSDSPRALQLEFRAQF
ncbi:carboxypeptidase regulatory-like domain-containing protein [Silvibacterium acidisoli]|uniref:carboxypeptidase regulatory-like domain-containing protein n=1 Tax=Acidobacteriaceae bacterium ZG23-2 TaxID=2883246 RepID=UPI00406C8D04